MTLVVRDATERDLGAILQIERTSFIDPWTIGMFRTHLQGTPNIFLVAVSTDTTDDLFALSPNGVLGFAVAQVIRDEAELLDIAVPLIVRGQGVGATLLDQLIGRCATMGAETLFLEVRESNDAARALYASRQFVEAGRRKRYYHNPTEDGLILKMTIAGKTADSNDAAIKR